MITFQCGACGNVLRTADDKAGKNETCSECGALVAIPDKLPPVEPGVEFLPVAVPVEEAGVEAEPCECPAGMEQGRPVTPEWIVSVPGSRKGPATVYDDPKPTKSEGVSDKPKDDTGDLLTGLVFKSINAQFDFAFTDDDGASHEVSIFACYNGFQGCVAGAAILDGSLVILRSGKWDCSYQANALRFSVDLRRKKGKLRCGSREFGFLSIKEGDEIEKNRIAGSPLGPRNELIRDSVHNMRLRGLGRPEAPSSVRSGMKPIAVGVAFIVGCFAAVASSFILALLAGLLSADLPAVPTWLLGICGILAIGAGCLVGKTVYFFFAACFPENEKNGDRQERREDKA